MKKIYDMNPLEPSGKVSFKEKKDKKIKLHEPTFGVEEIFNFTEQLISTNVTMENMLNLLKKNFVKS